MSKNKKNLAVTIYSSNRIICNPLFLYVVSWFVVIFLYLLNWSDKYPPISLKLLSFLSGTCLLSLVLAIITHKKKRFEYKALVNPQIYYKWIMKQTKRVYLLLFVEFVYFQTIPLLSYLKGNTDNRLYMDFAMPIIHIFVLNGVLLLFYFSSYCYFSQGRRKNSFLKPMLINFAGPLLFMSRGSALYMMFGLFLLYLMSGKKIVNVMIFLMPMSLMVLFLFGQMGNLRINDPEGELILQWGGASQKFEESFVPKEFFWSYVYITSPLGNLQNAIDQKKNFNGESFGVIPLVVNEVFPMFISKRLDIPEPKGKSNYYVDPTMVVGSTYFDAYLTWKWYGMIVVFCFILFYVFVMQRIIPRDSVFRVPMYVVLAILTFFSLFDNMLVYMGLFPQLVFIYLLRKRETYILNVKK
ncbi:MAG: oligosaccharide repeat unit polymerase [Bacteroides sp.]|nr:oligosaccharide repeat unit polymerase [Bacteroides sp.]